MASQNRRTTRHKQWFLKIKNLIAILGAIITATTAFIAAVTELLKAGHAFGWW